MQLLLSVPFRTDLCLQPLFVARRSEDLIAALQAVASRIAKLPGWALSVATHAVPDGQHSDLYTSLDEDLLPATSLPLFSAPVNVARIEAGAPAPCDFTASLQQAELFYFDQTVGILELKVELDLQQPPLPNAVDKWSVALARHALERCAELTDALESAMLAVRTQAGDPVALPCDAQGAFFDRASRAQGTPSRDLLWASRVLVVGEGVAELPWLQDWTQERLDEEDRIDLGPASAAVCIGNSVVFRGAQAQPAVTAMIKSLRICNMFYALVHVLSANQRLVHAGLLGQRNDHAEAGNITQAVRSRLNLIEHEYEDTVLGLQGLRSTAVQEYMRVWKFDNLLATCTRRIASVDVLVQAALQQRNLRYTRVVEAALTLIGGLTLLDVSLNLMTFSRTPGLAQDKFFGLVDLARTVPENVLLHVLIAIVIGVSAFKLRRKQD